MKRSKEELLASLQGLLTENVSDEALSFIEDLSDSMEDGTGEVQEQDNTALEELSLQMEQLQADYESKLLALETEWRNKYKERFFRGEEQEDPEQESEEADTDETNVTEEDIFLDDENEKEKEEE